MTIKQKIIFILIFLFFLFFLLAQVFMLSATFDEPLHLFAGMAYYRDGRLDINEGHPPLAKYISSSILVFSKGFNIKYGNHMDWEMADNFFLKSYLSPDTILILGRIPSLIFGIFLFFILFKFLKQLFGDIKTVFCGLFLFAFTPIFLNHFSLANNDFLLLFFSFLAVYTYLTSFSDIKKYFLLILFCALGFMSKFSGIVLFIVPLFHIFEKRIPLKYILISMVSVLTVILMLYQFRINYLYSSLISQLSQIYTGWRLYFLGRFYDNGTPIYILVLIFKLSVFYIVYMIAGSSFLKKRHTPLYLLLILTLLTVMLSRKQAGVRYFIPAFPILYIWAIHGISVLLKRSKHIVLISFILIFFFVIREFPDLISYHNELIPVSKRYLISSDSDLDWGQNLKRIKRWTEKNDGEYHISYFGTDEPARFFPCENILSVSSYGKDFMTLRRRENSKKYIMISATNLVGKYYDRDYFKKFKSKRPVKTFNGSFFIFYKE